MSESKLTPEQNKVLRFMRQHGQSSLVYWAKDELPVHVSENDFIVSRPLAEIFAAKISLYEQGDLSQFSRKAPF